MNQTYLSSSVHLTHHTARVRLGSKRHCHPWALGGQGLSSSQGGLAGGLLSLPCGDDGIHGCGPRRADARQSRAGMYVGR